MTWPRTRLDRWVDILRPWPVLLVAVVAIGASVALLAGSGRAAELATGLAILGAVCLGAWLALLAAYGRHPADPNDREDNDDGRSSGP